jgi:hypothetical protein
MATEVKSALGFYDAANRGTEANMGFEGMCVSREPHPPCTAKILRSLGLYVATKN